MLGALLDPVNHIVDVGALGHRGDLQQDVGLGGGSGTRHGAVNVEQLFGCPEKAGARPVRERVVSFRRSEDRTRFPRLRDGEQGREPVRRCPAGVAGVDQDLVVSRQRRELIEHLFERDVVERWRHGNDGRHRGLNSPRRWWAKPVAPRWPTLRAAATTAARIASANLSPASSREK